MKKTFLLSPLHILLFLFVFISSCSGQDKSKANVNQDKEEPSVLGRDLQLNYINSVGQKNNYSSNNVDYSDQVSRSVRTLYQDSRGLIWMATNGSGLALVISGKLTYFKTKDGLGSDQISDITEDIHGNMWFATTNGVSMYPGGEFTNFTTKDGLQDNQISSVLADSKGNVWVGTEKGVSKYDGKTFSPFELPKPSIENPTYIVSLENVWQIIEDKNGSIWFARDGYGATKYDGKNFTHFTKKDGLCGNDVASIVEDKSGNIWFGTIATRVPSKENKFHYIDSDDGGLSMYDGKSIKQFPTIKGLKANDIHALYTDTDGSVWVGAKHYGLYKYDGESFELFREGGGFTNNCPQSVLEDTDGKMWFGFSGGLFTLTNEKVVNVTRSDLGYIGNPYAIKFKVNKLAGANEFELEIRMELDSFAYFVSPVSKENYKGFFNLEIEDRGLVKLGNEMVENPKSIESIDEFSHEPVNFVTQNTTYTQKFTVNSKHDFEVNGIVKFVIEPKCTMEEIPFLIMYRDGKFKVRKVGMGGC